MGKFDNASITVDPTFADDDAGESFAAETGAVAPVADLFGGVVGDTATAERTGTDVAAAAPAGVFGTEIGPGEVGRAMGEASFDAGEIADAPACLGAFSDVGTARKPSVTMSIAVAETRPSRCMKHSTFIRRSSARWRVRVLVPERPPASWRSRIERGHAPERANQEN